MLKRALAGIFVLSCCLSFGSVVGQETLSPQQQFWRAAGDGDVDKVRQLIASGVDVNAVTEFNCGAVYFAANRGRSNVIRALIEAGADINLRDSDYGFTPIQMAAWMGYTDSTKLLLDAGAASEDVITAGFAAAANGHARTVELIVSRTKIPQSQLDEMWQAAHSANRPEVCAILEKAGAVPRKGAGRADDPSIVVSTTKSVKEVYRGADQPSYDFSADRPIKVTSPANWPAFRGFQRSGIADGQYPPAGFDLATNRNIKWTTKIPGLGHSSPVIWQNRVFVTTAVSQSTRQTIDDEGLNWIDSVSEDTPHEWKVQCYDLLSGELLWEKTARAGRPRTHRHWKASQANSTCATDGRHIVAFFGSEGLHCFDMDGNLEWQKDLGHLNAGWYIDSSFEWGFASSPVIYRDTVIVQCDTSDDSFVAAYQLADGTEKWRTERSDELPSWGTPLVVHGENRDELVTNASRAVCGYDPNSGEQLWELRGNSRITVSSPIEMNQLILATGGYKTPKPIYVIRPGADGDITPEPDGSNEQVVWSRQKGGSYVVTPLMYRGRLYLCKPNGVVTALDPKTGESIFKKRLKTGSISASPVAADGKIFFVGEDGTVVVVLAGETFQEFAVNELNASVLATPAISNGIIVYRTVKGLVAVSHDDGR